MKLSKLVIAIFAMSAAGAMAHGNKSTSQTSQGNDQSNQATASADGSSLMQSNNVSQAQQALNDKGFDAGQVDGKLGPHTEAALKKFQASEKIDQSGKLDQQTLAALGVGSGNIQSASNGANGTASPSSEPSQSSQPSQAPQSSQASGNNGSTASSMSGTNASTPAASNYNNQASGSNETQSSSASTK